MPTRLYKDYIKVDPNFIPVFSRNSDKVYPDKWQSFYPHENFKNILTSVVETLEKGSATKDNSLWMSGTYGTGKTYASFTVKHILEDSIETVQTYCEANNMQNLFARIKGIRSKGEILVVHRSASANINSQNKLFNAIVESVKETLQIKGFKDFGNESLMEKVISTLKDPNSAFNFSGAFNKYKARFTDYSSPQSVIRDLEELELEERLELLDIIISVAEDESYTWSLSPDEVINWLEDVRIKNNIYAIVFIWDEFTEYFKNNQNNITGLQEIAMASSRISFYFFLITHSDSNQLIADSNQRKIIQARFKQNQIKLGENAAFKLMGQALRHEPDLSDEWKRTSDDLWNGVMRGTVKHIKDKDVSINTEDFVKLLPMHPYAVYLLKFIAQDIGSDQRTMFQFLSGDIERTNFTWFINNFSFEYGKYNYLTVDYLWDYFLQDNNVDLDSSFANAMSHYNNFEGMCQTESQKRILKVTLLLSALQAKNASTSRMGATSLLRPTFNNIAACFAGTPLESTISSELDYFTSKGILGEIDDFNDRLYVMTSVLIDKERMEKMLEETRKDYPFEKIITDTTYDILKQFKPNDFLQYRLDIRCITPANCRSEADKTKNEPNLIPTFYLFACNEIQQGKVKDTIVYLYGRFTARCIVVDFSSLPFTDTMYEKFAQSKGKEKYFNNIPNQKDQLKLAKQASADIVKEWANKLITTSLHVYSKQDHVEIVMGGVNLRKKLKEINTQMYGYGLEELTSNDKMFAQSGYKETVAEIAMGKTKITSNYSYLNILSSSLATDGIWNNPNYSQDLPEHIVSRMKQAVEQVISKGFSSNSMVCVLDIWQELKKPPIGLLSCTGSVFIFAFLLKEYADGSYYKRDINTNGGSLNYKDLCNLIYAVVKELPKAKDQFIVKQTPEHASFCQLTGEIFKISKDKRNSIDDIVKNVNLYLTNNNYPLWSLKYYVQEDYYEHEMRDELIRLVDLLCEFVNPKYFAGRDKTNIAEDIYKLYVSNAGIDKIMGDITNNGCMNQGMQYYIAQYKPELITIASNLKINSNEYLSLLKQKLSADSSYLWQTGDINHQIDNLYTDLRLIYAVNRVLSSKENTLSGIMQALSDKLNIIKVPDTLLKVQRPDLQDILRCFYAVRNNQIVDKSITADIIDAMADDFLSFFNNQFDVFSTVVKNMVDNTVNSDELDYLYNNVQSGILFSKTDEFILGIKRELDKFRKNIKTRKLFESWEEITGSKSPADWSKVHRLPILCAFSDDIVKAQEIFAALNKKLIFPSEDKIELAIQFIKSDKMKILSDIQACEKLFISYFCGEYAYVVEDADSLRDTLRETAGNDIYEWYAKQTNCKQAIKSLAEDRYKTKYRSKVRDKVRNMTASETQRYLEELIDKDPLLGIRILQG